MAKKMTQKRKVELFEGCLNWIADHAESEESHMDALIWIGMTDDEIVDEMMFCYGVEDE